MEEIRKLLSSCQETTTWLEHLEAIGAPDFEVVLPSADELPPVLLELAVPHEDIDDLVAMLPSRERPAELWWLLERCTHSLVREMGRIDGPPRFPVLPESMGVLHRYFYIYVFLACCHTCKRSIARGRSRTTFPGSRWRISAAIWPRTAMCLSSEL